MVENPVPPSNDFFSPKIWLINVVFPEPDFPKKRILIKAVIFVSSTIFTDSFSFL